MTTSLPDIAHLYDRSGAPQIASTLRNFDEIIRNAKDRNEQEQAKASLLTYVSERHALVQSASEVSSPLPSRKPVLDPLTFGLCAQDGKKLAHWDALVAAERQAANVAARQAHVEA